MKNVHSKSGVFFFISSSLLLLCILFLSQCSTNNKSIDKNISSDSKAVDSESKTLKQKGFHVFGIVDSTDFNPIHKNNIEWISMVPWGFQDNCASPNVTHHNNDSVYMEEHNQHWIDKIHQVRAAGFKVFYKPHLWILEPIDGTWRSDIYPTNDENWEIWKDTYRNFILRYALVAEQGGADMFCIGTEFSRLTIEKPEFWENLIEEIKGVYSGKVTYAANWYSEFEKITFWDQLDFIGIQAYFPLAINENPSIENVAMGWDQYLPAIEGVSERFNKKILFTEMGYKSTAGGAIKPWDWVEDPKNLDKVYSEETQANCYQAFFKKVWKNEWFAGVHFWQMRTDYVVKSGKINLDFTPHGKQAENIITKGFE